MSGYSVGLDHTHGGVVFLACEDFCQDVRPFIPRLHFSFFFFSFFKVEISLRTRIILFRPGSVHSGSASWDDWPQIEVCLWPRPAKADKPRASRKSRVDNWIRPPFETLVSFHLLIEWRSLFKTKNLKQSWLPAFWKKIQNTQEINKRTLVNWTKQDNTYKFSRKSSFSSYARHKNKRTN